MKPESPFVWADGTVELYAIAQIHLHFAFVINPWHTERDDPFWFYNAFYDFCLLEFRMLAIHVLDRLEYFAHSLQVFQFTWVLTLQILHDFSHFHSLCF